MTKSRRATTPTVRLLLGMAAGALACVPATLLAGDQPGAASQTAPQAAPASGPEAARAVLAKWMETERIIAQERADWQHTRDMLRARIDLVKGEIEAQREKSLQLRDADADLAKSHAGVDAGDRSARESLDLLAGACGDLESAIRGLSASFPEPLVARVRPLLDRMPADPAHTKVSLAERYQNIIGILNEANKFDGDIVMNAEVRTLSDGAPSEVRVVYLGLGQAYFVTKRGEAGVGRPAPGGWRWETDKSIAPAVAQVIDILMSRTKPKLIPLPVTIQ